MRRERQAAGWAQEELAARAGVSVRTVRNIELSRVARPRTASVQQLLAALRTPGDDRYPAPTSAAGPPRTELGVLGPLSIERGGRAVALHSPRLRTLVGLLAIQPGQAVTREEIVDTLWGPHPPRTCHALVKTYVARLRDALEPDRLPGRPARTVVRASGAYVLAPGPEQLDLATFDALLRQGVARWTGGDPAGAEPVLARALDCWRGPVLGGAGIALTQHPAAVAAAQRRLIAATAYADVGAALVQHDRVAPRLHRLLADEPLHEGLHARLMIALAGCGQQAAALGLFADLRARLADELGIEPGPEVRAAHLRVLRQDVRSGDAGPGVGALPGPGVDPAAAPAPLGPPALPPGARVIQAQLPADVTAFTGRSAELAVLERVLVDDPAATAPVILCITGMAGVGKTALALHGSHRLRDRYAGGQLYVNLRGYDPDRAMVAEDALAALLTALVPDGYDLPVGVEARAARYRTEVAGRRMLIVLDNASTVEQLRPLLPGSPGCAVLVTSRDSLAGLVALHGAHRLVLHPLPERDATALLRRLIGRAVEEEPAAAKALVRRCGGLPLALRVTAELALARSPTPLAELVAELAARQSRLELLSGGGDPRAAVRAVFSWSVQHLSAPGEEMFALLGVHPGSQVDGYAAAALAGTDVAEANRRLDLLARAHLVHRIDTHLVGPGRYGMHDLLRAYAAELADGAQPANVAVQREAAARRLVRYLLATAAAAMHLLYPGEAPRRPRIPPPTTPVPVFGGGAAARRWLDTELPNLVAVSAYGAAAGWLTETVQLSSILFRYLDDGNQVAALAIHGQAREAAQRLGDRTSEAMVLVAVGGVLMQTGRRADAVEALHQAVLAAHDGGDRLAEARAVGNLGQLEERLGGYRSSAAHYQRALQLYGEVGDRTGRAHALTRLGVVQARLGHYTEGAGHLRQALVLHRRIGHGFGEAWAMLGLGELATRTGRPKAAALRCRQALERFRQLGNRSGEAWALTGLGTAEHHRGRRETALELHRQARQLFRDVGDADGEASALNSLGEATVLAGQGTDALTHHRDALVIASRTGAREEQARAHTGLARAHEANDESTRARPHRAHAQQIRTGLGMPGPHRTDAELTR